MSTTVEDIWNPPAAPAESVTETPAATTDAPAETTDAATADATPATNAETPTPAEVTESPAAEPGKPADDAKAEASDEDAQKTEAEQTAEQTDAKLPPDVRGRLRKGTEAIEAMQAVSPLIERVGGVPVLQDLVALQEAFEAEDWPTYFNLQTGLSQSKAEAAQRTMVEAALEDAGWQAVGAEKYLAAKHGKSLAEVDALLAGSPAAKPADAVTKEGDAAESDYDAEGNYITPEAREIAALKAKLEAIEQGQTQTKEQQEAKAREEAEAKQLRETNERIAVRDQKVVEFIGQVEEPIQAKIKDAGLLPADGDSPELLELKRELAESIQEETAKEFFNGKDTKAFADRTLEYFARGEYEVANKRLDAARRAAEQIANRHIERASQRISEHIAATAHKLNQTTTRQEVVTAAGGAIAPGNHSGVTDTSPTPTSIDDIWAVDPASTKDALARDPWKHVARA